MESVNVGTMNDEGMEAIVEPTKNHLGTEAVYTKKEYRPSSLAGFPNWRYDYTKTLARVFKTVFPDISETSKKEVSSIEFPCIIRDAQVYASEFLRAADNFVGGIIIGNDQAKPVATQFVRARFENKLQTVSKIWAGCHIGFVVAYKGLTKFAIYRIDDIVQDSNVEYQAIAKATCVCFGNKTVLSSLEISQIGLTSLNYAPMITALQFKIKHKSRSGAFVEYFSMPHPDKRSYFETNELALKNAFLDVYKEAAEEASSIYEAVALSGTYAHVLTENNETFIPAYCGISAEALPDSKVSLKFHIFTYENEEIVHNKTYVLKSNVEDLMRDTLDTYTKAFANDILAPVKHIFYPEKVNRYDKEFPIYRIVANSTQRFN